MGESEDGNSEKVIRLSKDLLKVSLSEYEIRYRETYLPDPEKLTDEKLVCSVCSVSLAQNVRNGSDIYNHRFLGVLVCEECYKFYGDGIFSVDEDGDDKYCRWCGQGGTLNVCSSCTCAFCQKCVNQNMKPSAIADVQRDDWKCYICVPRPLFGCRTICWAANELNKIGKNKKRVKLKKQAEKLKKIAEIKKEKILKRKKHQYVFTSEDENITQKRKHSSDESSFSDTSSKSSDAPRKKRKLGLGFIVEYHDSKRSRSKEDFPVSLANGHLKRKVSKSKESSSLSSSEESSSSRHKVYRKLKRRKKTKKNNSDKSSDETNSESMNKSFKKRSTYKVSKSSHQTSSTESDSSVSDLSITQSDDTLVNESLITQQENHHEELNLEVKECQPKEELQTDNTLVNESLRTQQENHHEELNLEVKECQPKDELQTSLSHNTENEHGCSKIGPETNDVSCILESNIALEDEKLESSTNAIDSVREAEQVHESQVNQEDISCILESNIAPEYEKLEISTNGIDSVREGEQVPESQVNQEEATEITSKLEVAHNDNDTADPRSALESNIESAVTWIKSSLIDISEFSSVIAVKTNKFQNKISVDQIKSFDDVTKTYTKLKQTLVVARSNFTEIEESLEADVTNWKGLTGIADTEDKVIEADCGDPREGTDSHSAAEAGDIGECNGSDKTDDSSKLEQQLEDRLPDDKPPEDKQGDQEKIEQIKKCNIGGIEAINLSDQFSDEDKNIMHTNNGDLTSSSVVTDVQTKNQYTNEGNKNEINSTCYQSITSASIEVHQESGNGDQTNSINATNSKIHSAASSKIIEDSELAPPNKINTKEAGFSDLEKSKEVTSELGREIKLTQPFSTTENVQKCNSANSSQECSVVGDHTPQVSKEQKTVENVNEGLIQISEVSGPMSVTKINDNPDTLQACKVNATVEMCELVNISFETNTVFKDCATEHSSKLSNEHESLEVPKESICDKLEVCEKGNTENISENSNYQVVTQSETVINLGEENEEKQSEMLKISSVEKEKNLISSDSCSNLENINKEGIIIGISDPIDNTPCGSQNISGNEVNISDKKIDDNMGSLRLSSETDLEDSHMNKVDEILASTDKDLNENLSSQITVTSSVEVSIEEEEKELENVPCSGTSKTNSEATAEKDNLNCDEALQAILNSSTSESELSSTSDSDDSSSLHLDDSDLDVKKIICRKTRKPKNKTKSCVIKKGIVEEKDEEAVKKLDKKAQEEEVDSEAEINMLTDLSKLKKKSSRRLVSQHSNADSDETQDSDQNSNDNEENKSSRKGRKYNNESKRKRQEDRNELFAFLKGTSGSEDDVDITKDDLNKIEDDYASSSNESMSLEAFSLKMKEKEKEIEKQQEEMNLQMLLAPDSDEGSVAEDDFILEPDSGKKRRKKADLESKDTELDVSNIKEEENNADQSLDNVKKEISDCEENKSENNDKYEEFLEIINKTKPQFQGLGSSSDDSNDAINNLDIKEELSTDQFSVKKEPLEGNSSDSVNSDSSEFLLTLNAKKSWRTDKLLKVKVSDTDTSDEERRWKKREEKERRKKDLGEVERSTKHVTPKKVRKKVEKRHKKSGSDADSESLDLSSSDSSDSVFKKKKRKKGKSDSDVNCASEDEKKKKKRRKRGLSESSSEDSDSDDDVVPLSQKSNQGESPKGLGRKNIRKVKTKHELAAATKAAAKEEEERKKRIAARQKMFNEIFEIKEAEVLEKLVLDFDPETKTELISVDRDLVVKMKPHQAKGVKFMWDSCFESLSQLKTKKGSGCILAHCMGLGKTFQVISLVHTILKHDDTHVRTVLVVCPLSTVLNWNSEFVKWLDDVPGGKDIKLYHLTSHKRANERVRQLNRWKETGGVMILGYEMFRILTNPNTKKFRLSHQEVFQKTLIDPGADLVVCDEGHMLKNESTQLSKAMSRIRTLRRIVLTGTPMQNNLKEYHCMVQFVKPNLLGTRKEFLNQFVNPITNGQFVDSTEKDVKIMKRRSHVLHKMLEGLVQRYDYSVLTPFLPPKHEYVISLRLSELQVRLYQYYLDHICKRTETTSSKLFQDWQSLSRIWTHPLVLKMCTDKYEKENPPTSSSEELDEEDLIKKEENADKLSVNLSPSHSTSSSDSDDKANLNKAVKEVNIIGETSKNSSFLTPPLQIEAEINLISSEEEENTDQIIKEDESNLPNEVPLESESKETNQNECANNLSGGEEKSTGVEENVNSINSEENQADGNEVSIKEKSEDNKELEANNEKSDVEINKELEADKKVDEVAQTSKSKMKDVNSKSGWWKSIVDPEQLEDINQSAKLILLFAILKESEMIEDKVLVFSQSLFSLDLIEHFLRKVDQATEEVRLDESVGCHTGSWTKGVDYFRLDGSTNTENRSAWCKSFNRDDNPRARLFLISTRAGGLGINLTGANRVVIFDASWNPSHDIQSIFRVFRFGQKKPCYVYRFIASGTMEEKVYDRQVAKQLLSSRVVDEQQVHRHFSMSDLNELYRFTPPSEGERETPALPKDKLMAELLSQCKVWIEKYHEHDSLLENIADEELNEEERRIAWEDYENEKKAGALPPFPGMSQSAGVAFNQRVVRTETLRQSLKTKYPNSTEAELNAMLTTLMNQIQNMEKSRPMATGYRPVQGQQHSTTQINMPQNSMMQNNNMLGLPKNQVLNRRWPGSHLGQNNRIGNGLVKQFNKSEKTQPVAGSRSYSNEMRIQQEANLARVRNQNQIAQSLHPSIQQPNRTYHMQQNKPNAPNYRSNQSSSRQIFQNGERGQNNQNIRNPHVPSSIWKPKQQMAGNKVIPNVVLNRRQGSTPVISQVRPNTQLQTNKEKINQSLNTLKQINKPNLVQRNPKFAKPAGLDLKMRLKMEEMRRRYNASRKPNQNNSEPEVVEILDDDGN